LLAQALMSIQAMKAVEIGEGLSIAGGRGSVAHAIAGCRRGEYVRESSRGRHRGGGDHRRPARRARRWKPLATQPAGAQDRRHRDQEESVSFKERTDVTSRCPPPGSSPRQ
jgi:chorismate synthase